MKKTIFSSADIMFPRRFDLKSWSVIACDQFTSDPGYWEEVKRIVGESPSTLDFILPEAYLGTEREALINQRIVRAMDNVREDDFDVFRGFVYVRRTLPCGLVREGLVGMLDLEEYDYSHDSESRIRATEETVISRIPARKAIRDAAKYELPHAMVFVSSECDVIAAARSLSSGLCPLYDFDLMMDGGHIIGYKLDGALSDSVSERICEYENGSSGVLYAIGDGNHSLAAAKAHYECVKKEIGRESARHPSRYVLCEIVNISDASIVFEPIYRIVKGCDPDNLISELGKITGDKGDQRISVVTRNCSFDTCFSAPSSSLTVGSVQDFIDGYIAENPGAECDYIHGKEELLALSSLDGSVGFVFDGVKKEDLFRHISANGPYPRKTFSMGDARSKRYYLEMRKIV